MLEQWADEVADALSIPDDVALQDILDLARDVAHAVERPAAPVTAFLIGRAVERAGGAGSFEGLRAEVDRLLADR